MARTGDELIKEWAKGAKGGQILNMTEPELVGWRLYETHVDLDDPKGKRRIPDELYYVARKKAI